MTVDQPAVAAGLGIPSAGTTYPSYRADGRYQPHATLYMQRGLVHSGQFTDRRPSTALLGTRFQSMPDRSYPGSQKPLGTLGSSGMYSSLNMHALAAQEVMASQMAAQLLSYAGHPAFASYMRVRSELPTDYYEQPQLYLSQVGTYGTPANDMQRTTQHLQVSSTNANHSSAQLATSSSTTVSCSSAHVAMRSSSVKCKASSEGGTQPCTAAGNTLPPLLSSTNMNLNSRTADDSLGACPSQGMHVAFTGGLGQQQQQHQLQWQAAKQQQEQEREHHHHQQQQHQQQQSGMGNSMSMQFTPPRTPHIQAAASHRPLMPMTTAAATTRQSTSAWSMQAPLKASPTANGNTRAGWANTLGDYFDSDTRTWLRLPCEVPTEQLPKYQRAMIWHTHKVWRRAFNCWRFELPAQQQHKQCKFARAGRKARHTLLCRCLASLQQAVRDRQVKNLKRDRAWSLYCGTLRCRCLQAWQEWLWESRGWRERQLVATRKLQKVRLRMIMHAWRQEYVPAKQDARVLNTWARNRMQTRRLFVCLHKLQEHAVSSRYKKQQALYAVQHWRRAVLLRAMHGWHFVLQRSRHRAWIQQRAEQARNLRLVAACFKAWQVSLLEAVRDALTEQVYDLKRELQHAVAWSD